MIIPVSNKKINIGDIVININNIKNEYYLIPIGHEFKVISYDESYDRYEIKSIDDEITFKIDHSALTKKIDLKVAKNEYIFKVETIEYKSDIVGCCPNKTVEYDDREEYIGCSISKFYGKQCIPNLNCAKYLTKEQINKSKVLLKYLRINKMNKINED